MLRWLEGYQAENFLKISPKVFRLAFILEINFPVYTQALLWDYIKLTMMFQSSRVLSLISTHMGYST